MERSRPAALALAALSVPMLLASLGTSVANVALPTLEHEFAASFGRLQWVVLAYLLAVTTLVVTAGHLGDLLGRRRALMAGLALFTAASALCAAAPGLDLLILARAVQGAGAALMMVLALASVADALPSSRTGAAMGLLGTMSAVGTALGPSLGGTLIAAAGWRAMFLVNVPIGVVALVLASRHLPAARAPGQVGPRVDLAGIVLLAVALGAYALAMTTGRGGAGAALLALAALAAGLFVAAERRSPAPLVRPALLRDGALRAGLATSALVSTVMMTTLVVGPFHLSRALGLGPAAVGLAMSAGPAVVALAGVPAGRLADRLGAGHLGVAGLVTMAVGAILVALTPLRLGVAGYVLPVVVLTLGYALFQTANNAGVMAGADADRRGVTSGLLTLSRNLGLVTGASAMGALFALAAGTSTPAGAPPGAVVTGMRTTFAVAAALIAVAILIAAGPALSARATPSPRGSAP
jgi:EmrB/QacA subfamily drug resistance transporter